MKFKNIKIMSVFLLFALSLNGCGGGSGSGDSSAPNQSNPQVRDVESFDGKLASFSVGFERPFSGSLANSNLFFLSYKFEVRSNVLGRKGVFNIFDCQDGQCSSKSLMYKLDCNFDLLTCKATDRLGREIKKGTPAPNGTSYQVDASDVGFLSVVSNCNRTWGGEHKICAFLTFVDPQLLPEGFFNKYVAAEFAPELGATVGPVIFHLNSRP